MSEFVHLHLHSEYSLLDGACRISEIPEKAKAEGHTAVAITDHGAMYGVVDFYNACKKEGLKPIIGCEVYVASGSRLEKNKAASENYHLVLLVKNEVGYRNLIYMVSKAFTEGFYSKPRIDMELLEKHSEGLIALSACLAGYIPQMILGGSYDSAKKMAEKMRDLFEPDSFYLEIQDHGIPEQREVNSALLRLSRETGIPLVATNDVHYPEKKHAEYQAILLCIQTNNVITDGRPIGFETDEFYYKSTEEMKALFSSYEGAIENTVKIADMCNFDFDFSKTFLPRYRCPGDVPAGEYLKELAMRGLEDKIASGKIVPDSEFSKEDYLSRMDGELSVIDSMGYSEYFLIVWDFVNFAHSNGIPVGPGRGSGAGSLVAFLIGITDIDSLKYGLIFESFLNVDRVSMPDFDIDFADNRREEVIDYVKAKYGDDHVAQIITFGTMAAKAVVRDVGRALGMPYGAVDVIAKMIPRDSGLKKALDSEPRLRDSYDSDPDVRRLIDTAMALEGMPRHASTHAAGVVITDRPVHSYVPLAVNSGNPLTQFDMDTIAKLGLLKFDFLGIKYLTVIDEAERQIREKDPAFDIEKIPFDDEKTYRLICKGNTEGVFQLNSQGMRAKLMQMKPECFEDIIAAIALYRPGPIKAGAVDAYADNKRDRSRIKYVTPLLAPVLDSTYGCIVYQEQVAQIFRELGGYSFSRADNVRRAIKKKDADIIQSEKEKFIEGAAGNGISKEAAEKIFSDIEGFSKYAFNKSHSTAYAVTAYRTAYLKAHYMTEYYSALMNSEPSVEYLSECRKKGIKILPPDVNSSFHGFHVEDGSIRYGLLQILNVGRILVDRIVSDRTINGRYASFDDFITRTEHSDLNRKQYEMLVKSGALDCFGIKRSCMLALTDKVMEARSSRDLGLEGQLDIMSMLGGEDRAAAERFIIPDFPELPLDQRLRYEKESLGMYISGSPIEKYSEHISRADAVAVHEIKKSFSEDSEESSDLYDGQKITVAGIINKRVNKNTRKGDPMAFVTIEDLSGEIEIVVFPGLLSSIGYLLVNDTAILVKGTISAKDDDVSILADRISLLKENSPDAGTKSDTKKGVLYIKIDDVGTEKYQKVRSIICDFRGDTEVVFYSENKKKYIKEKGLLTRFTKSLFEKLCELLGESNVVFK